MTSEDSEALRKETFTKILKENLQVEIREIPQNKPD